MVARATYNRCLEGLRKKVYSGKELLKIIRLGDKIEAMTKAVGIKPCGDCYQRKDWMNGEDSKESDKESGSTTPDGMVRSKES